MDSFYRDQQGYGSMPNHWSGYSQGENYVACNSASSTFPSSTDTVFQRLEALQAQLDASVQKFEKEKQNSLEAKVFDRFNILQEKMDEMAERNDKIREMTWRFIQSELTVTEKNLENRLEICLQAYEERSIKRFEEYSRKTTHMLEKLESRIEKIQKRLVNDAEIEAVVCQVQRLENKMETEMRQLYHGMYRAQGKIVETDSDDDCVECIGYLGELPGYIDESIKRDARNSSLEMRCESISPISCANNETERLLCEDIASLRGGCHANETVHEHSLEIEGMREVDYMACAPVEERDYSIGTELPLRQEDAPLSPDIRTCYSCEIACAPQVKACFGVLASSALRENSQEESSWEEKDPMVDFEVQKRKRKNKRQVVAQVWIPRGTLEVMKVFNMTEINLGEKSCVPHKAKKRKRRKSSNPQSGIG